MVKSKRVSNTGVNVILIGFIVMAGFLAMLAVARSHRREAFSNKDNDDVAVIELYFADWCGHCKRAKPEWQSCCDEFDGKEVGGKTIKFKEIDCSDNKDTEIQAIMDENDVKGFPTVLGKCGGRTQQLQGQVNRESLEKFIIQL